MSFRMVNEFIDLKDEEWIEKQKVAGKAVSTCLKDFSDLLKNENNVSLIDIQNHCLSVISSFNCTPTFENYKGFPGSVCLSVNEVLVHGIPYDYILKSGDIVTLDLGATFDGAIADAAFTCIYKEPIDLKHVEMLKLCKESLDNAIENISVGKNLGIIGNSIYNTVKNSNFGLITNYGGHGISNNKPHSPPFVANQANITDGIIMQPGLSIAIEPILVKTSNIETKTLEDKWTVVTASGEVGCHFEHSVTIDLSGNVVIITNHGLEI